MISNEWKEIKDGYGLEEVKGPDLECCMCPSGFKNRKLYTDKPIGSYTGTNNYRAKHELMRLNCYCKYHAIYMFGDR